MDIQRQNFEEAFKKNNTYNVELIHGTNTPIFGQNSKGEYLKTSVQNHWEMWQQAQKVAVPDGFVLVDPSKVKYFSNDGENYEIHNTLDQAKREAEDAIEYFSDRLADQICNPAEDGNFQQVGYGVILGRSDYSVVHVVTQEDIEKGDYDYEVGTEILSLHLIEAQEQVG